MAIFDLGHVQSWLDDQHGGDRVLAVTRVMTPANYEVAEFGAAGTQPPYLTNARLVGRDPLSPPAPSTFLFNYWEDN